MRTRGGGEGGARHYTEQRVLTTLPGRNAHAPRMPGLIRWKMLTKLLLQKDGAFDSTCVGLYTRQRVLKHCVTPPCGKKNRDEHAMRGGGRRRETPLMLPDVRAPAWCASASLRSCLRQSHMIEMHTSSLLGNANCIKRLSAEGMMGEA